MNDSVKRAVFESRRQLKAVFGFHSSGTDVMGQAGGGDRQRGQSDERIGLCLVKFMKLLEGCSILQASCQATEHVSATDEVCIFEGTLSGETLPISPEHKIFARCFALCQSLDPEKEATSDSLEDFTHANYHLELSFAEFEYLLTAVAAAVFSGKRWP